MSTTDIYGSGKPTAPAPMPPLQKKRAKQRPSEPLGEVKKPSSQRTRRTRNTGTRRLSHLMRKPGAAKKLIISVMSLLVLLVLTLFVWDTFFRYTEVAEDPDALQTEQQQYDNVFN